MDARTKLFSNPHPIGFALILPLIVLIIDTREEIVGLVFNTIVVNLYVVADWTLLIAICQKKYPNQPAGETRNKFKNLPGSHPSYKSEIGL